MAEHGTVLVLDGLDGSGKSTQYELLQTYLDKQNVKYKAISFPDYEKPSSTLVKMYLSGEFSSTAGGVNAYAASSFYAVDRYASFKLYWEQDYINNKIILASRYVSSNAIHQMVKLPRDEWDDYILWLSDYEYKKLGLPKEDKVIFLDMPVNVSQKLLSKRYNGNELKKDIHESDIEYLNSCRTAALYAAKKLNWCVISCNDGDEPLRIETINEKLIKIVDEILYRYK